jgi:hypothetical protein
MPKHKKADFPPQNDANVRMSASWDSHETRCSWSSEAIWKLPGGAIKWHVMTSFQSPHVATLCIKIYWARNCCLCRAKILEGSIPQNIGRGTTHHWTCMEGALAPVHWISPSCRNLMARSSMIVTLSLNLARIAWVEAADSLIGSY